jgi:acyl dehydratase
MGAPDELLCPPITRVDIAWTCVATNDPSRIHLDDPYAREHAGYPSVLAPGTMLFGWVGERLEELAGGPANVRRWTIRLTAPLWPGDQVRLSTDSARLVDADGDARRVVELVATTMTGTVVAKVQAELAPVPVEPAQLEVHR